jgi:prefoldin subunit 5
MNGIEPQTAFEGYIKGQIESLNRDMATVKQTVSEMRDSWIFAKGKVAGLAAMFGLLGGGIGVFIKAIRK